MNKISDVIVIGAGVVGCSAAYYLSKRGIKVTVLERREIACGASGRNGSGARQSGRDNRELPLAMFGVQNIWPTLGDELGEDIEYIQNGNMRLGKTPEDLERLKTLVRENSSLGLDVRLLTDVKEIRELIPSVSEDVLYATCQSNADYAGSLQKSAGAGRTVCNQHQGAPAGKGGWKNPSCLYR